MTTNTNTDSAALIRLLDDLLWMYSQNQTHSGDLKTAVDAMIAEYRANPDHYSDGSPIGTEYIPDYAPNVIAWEPFHPPHRRIAASPRRIHPQGQQHSTGTSRSTLSPS